MREIKFRYIFEYEDNTVSFCINIKEIENGTIQRLLRPIDEDLSKFTLVSRDEFTGLHDCDGKEIYDGDIVEIIMPCGTPNEIPDTIQYNDSYGCFFLRTRYTSVCDLIQSDYSFKIIGNIHEAQ